MVETLDLQSHADREGRLERRTKPSSWWTASPKPAGTPSTAKPTSTRSSTTIKRPAISKAFPSWISAAASGATCSLVTRYLDGTGNRNPGARRHLASSTASRPSSPATRAKPSALDDAALQYLYPLIDQDIIAKIKNAPLPEAFYETLLQALQSSFIYDKLLISWINDLPNPELCSPVRRIPDPARGHPVGDLRRRARTIR